MSRLPSVGVIGAGMSGVACARALASAGLDVRVFEKGRGVGGRMATRRTSTGRFDHGAQYFTVQTPRFERQVRAWIEAGVAAEWAGTVVVLEDGGITSPRGKARRFVGVPAMNTVCRQIARGLDVRLTTRVASVVRGSTGWTLASDDGSRLGQFDLLVVAAPSPQAAELLEAATPEISRRAAGAVMAPCCAVMLEYAAPLGLGFDAAFVAGSPLSWAAHNSSKPERPGGECWLLHGSPAWSREHLERSSDEVVAELVAAFERAVGKELPRPAWTAGHRWRYALPTKPLADRALLDRAAAVAVCGDWCGGPRVEGAYLSGLEAAERLLEHA